MLRGCQLPSSGARMSPCVGMADRGPHVATSPFLTMKQSVEKLHDGQHWWGRVAVASATLVAIRAYQLHRDEDPHKRQLLASVGVPVDDWSEYKWKTVTLPALQTYKRLHGDLMVPITPAFVVPSDDAEWPRATWGQSLGKAVDILRKTWTELSVDRVKALDEMGFVWDVSAFKWQHQVFPALVEYKKRFGDVNVPQDYVVPRDDES